MKAEEAVLAVIDALDALGIPYMLSGSFAANYFGVPRATQDADFVLELEGKKIRSVAERLGLKFQLDPQMSFESVTGTSRFILHGTENEFTIELFLRSGDRHDQERFARRRQVPLLGRQVFLPTPEDVVVTKLRWLSALNRNKDRDDIRNVIAVQRENFDWPYIHRWCAEHGTRELLDEIRASIPPI